MHRAKKSLKVTLLSTFVLFVSAAIVALACFLPVSSSAAGAVENVYYEGDTSSNKVSLMFNVYEHSENVYAILDILDKFSVKSTFFIGGSWAAKNTDCLKEIVSRGHEVGNHGYFHREHDKLTKEKSNEEISLCHKLVLLNTGVNMNLFAPPSGAYNKDTADGAASLGYKCIMWTVDTIDWRDKDENLIFSRAKKAACGSLVLMHPTDSTVKALEKIIGYYIKNSLAICTVSENIEIKGEI